MTPRIGLHHLFVYTLARLAANFDGPLWISIADLRADSSEGGSSSPLSALLNWAALGRD
jgi:hypothetical protein